MGADIRESMESMYGQTAHLLIALTLYPLYRTLPTAASAQQSNIERRTCYVAVKSGASPIICIGIAGRLFLELCIAQRKPSWQAITPGSPTCGHSSSELSSDERSLSASCSEFSDASLALPSVNASSESFDVSTADPSSSTIIGRRPETSVELWL